MAVVGAKGTFAGPGGTSSDNSAVAGGRRRQLECDEVEFMYRILGEASKKKKR